MIWVDTDGCESAPQYCKYFITSVTKGLTKSVDEYVQRGRRRAPSRRAATSAPWRTAAPASRRSTTSTPRSRRARRRSSTKIKADIISGKIKITSPSQPK